jgi:predicted nuclease of predicted toxin-antitoxin system
MRFLVDAHLPRRLALRLRDAGHDAVHTLDLPSGNHTGDGEILTIAQREQRIVITKDQDFVDSFWLERQPAQLLLVSTGNITNIELEALFARELQSLVEAFTEYDFLELSRNSLIIHE